MSVVLRCSVRGCSQILVHEGSKWVCARGHSFDQHRAGFLNLLQPQDSRSRTPGDSKDVAHARRRLVEGGMADLVYRAFGHAIREHASANATALLDVGCGEGAFLRSIPDLSKLERHGLDISAPSIELAAKGSSDCFFVIANADRFIPYADGSFDVVTSIDARVNVAEFSRVLNTDGLILVAVPAADDLIELRESVQGPSVEKSRLVRVESELTPVFEVADRATVRESRDLQPADLRDLLAATYRGFRQSERSAVESLPAMRVTLSHDILALRRRRS